MFFERIEISHAERLKIVSCHVWVGFFGQNPERRIDLYGGNRSKHPSSNSWQRPGSEKKEKKSKHDKGCDSSAD